MIRYSLVFALSFLSFLFVEAQESNLQTFTPSALFSPGEYEVNLFNSLYTQDHDRDRDGNDNSSTQTQAFWNSQLQITTGLEKFPKLNVGMEVNLTSVRYGKSDENGVFDFFKGGETFSKTVVSSIGPRVKFNVSKKIPRLSIQSTLLIPIAKDLEKENFVAHDRYTWFTQLFYDRKLGEDFQVFLEADFLYRINRNSSNSRNFFRTPVSAFLSYFPTPKSTIFFFGQHSNRYEVVENDVQQQFGLSQWFTQIGVGGKYQITKSLGLELSYGNFIASRMDGAGYNVNFGLRYIYK